MPPITKNVSNKNEKSGQDISEKMYVMGFPSYCPGDLLTLIQSVNRETPGPDNSGELAQLQIGFSYEN